jgi:dinuclear metal center YbgI/SA1388 family protein
MPGRLQVSAALEALAPLHLSESWDNTGWIVDVGRARHERVLLTVDLTWTVFEEAKAFGADLIVAYHPPIFAGLKHLRAENSDEALLMALIRAEVSVYSPHTALDASEGGMTEWLGAALGAGVMRPILATDRDARVGPGRVVELANPVPLSEAILRIKAHLGLSSVRVSEGHGAGPTIGTLAACPGAGGSIFERVSQVDLLLTGEMRHHDILARKKRGTHVILTEHSNSERGYLPVFATCLRCG